MRRLLLAGVGAALGWAALIAVTGGVTLDTGLGRLSSHNPLRPLAVGLVLAAIYQWRVGFGWLVRGTQAPLSPPVVAGGLTLIVLAMGVGWGPTFAAGPDVSGYVGQAEMWHAGHLEIPVPAWVAQAPWPNAAWASSPIGWSPSPDQTHLVPVYPPGLPLLMALARLLGGPKAIFLVVPLLGAMAVWSTYRLTHAVTNNAWSGVAAAALTAASPVFVLHLLQSISDVPATACWTAALAAVAWAGRGSTLGAGLAAAFAILIRPNLAPLVVVPFAWLWFDPARRRQAPWFIGCCAVPVLFVMGLNWRWYGSPLLSGYGPAASLYSPHRIPENTVLYTRWLVSTHSAFVLAGLLAPVVVPPAQRLRAILAWLCFPVLVFAQYSAYLTFRDGWWYLRFLLPMLPVLFGGLCAVAFGNRIRLGGTLVRVVAVAVVIGVGVWEITFSRTAHVITMATSNQRFTRAIAYARALPASAVLVSNSYSGTLRLYTGRDVLRWETLRSEDLDVVRAYFAGLRRPLHFIGDPFEMDAFTRFFAGSRTIEHLEDARTSEPEDGFVAYDLSRSGEPQLARSMGTSSDPRYMNGFSSAVGP